MPQSRGQGQMIKNATYSVPQAGAMAGLSRNGAYDAARRGEIPVMKFGRVYRVPKAIWDRKLGLIDNKEGRGADIDQRGNFGSVAGGHSHTCHPSGGYE